MWPRLNGSMVTILVGLIGKDIQQSRAPHLHEAAADALGLRLDYRLFDTVDMGLNDSGLAQILDAAELLGFSGLNVTYPYKQQVLSLLSRLSDDAKLVGAVNTVIFKERERVGHNTDLYGFETAFEPCSRRVAMNCCVQLGAGGAGGATATGLLRMGIKQLLIFDTVTARTSQLVERLSDEFGPGRAMAVADPVDALRGADGLVNTTPVGMAGHPGSPVPLQAVKPSLWVVDIIYFPWQTELLRHARSIGCTVMNGGDMAAYQAAMAFELFTGRSADRRRMLESLQQAGTAPNG